MGEPLNSIPALFTLTSVGMADGDNLLFMKEPDFQIGAGGLLMSISLCFILFFVILGSCSLLHVF